MQNAAARSARSARPPLGKLLLAAFFALCIGTLAWLNLGAPGSLAEWLFLRSVEQAAAAGTTALDLATLMPGDWEMVCDSDSGDGPKYVHRFGRTYEAAGLAQERSWGLLFIAPDGSPIPVAGSCGAQGVELSIAGCKDRAEAAVTLINRDPACAYFGSPL
jgi:hypothetical protein